jgi:hypothetical protein
MSSVEIDSLLAVIGTALFYFKNPHKRFIIWTSGFVLVLFFSEWILFFADTRVGSIIWTTGAIGLCIAYFLRFKEKRVTREIWDYVKWIAIFIVIAYPWTIVYGDDNYWTVLRLLTFPSLGTMYLYDRLIFKPGKMKKKFVIILIAQSLLLLLFFTYSILLKNESNRLRIKLEEERINTIKVEQKLKEIKGE